MAPLFRSAPAPTPRMDAEAWGAARVGRLWQTRRLLTAASLLLVLGRMGSDPVLPEPCAPHLPARPRGGCCAAQSPRCACPSPVPPPSPLAHLPLVYWDSHLGVSALLSCPDGAAEAQVGGMPGVKANSKAHGGRATSGKEV